MLNVPLEKRIAEFHEYKLDCDKIVKRLRFKPVDRVPKLCRWCGSLGSGRTKLGECGKESGTEGKSTEGASSGEWNTSCLLFKMDLPDTKEKGVEFRNVEPWELT